ncbi:hypothetical protein J3R82DRAFT_10158 [Butyriboletus roseoflavus]|nr:hypothetical protein J3R82DRAFT_10158 [Butyriboletus roseoflavus]
MHPCLFQEDSHKQVLSTQPQVPLERLLDGPCLLSGESLLRAICRVPLRSSSDGRTSTPPPINNGSALIGAGSDAQSRTTSSTSFVQPKGLQLGGSKTNAKAVAVQLAEQVAAEEGGNNNWGNNDLMDVNADEGDWSAFESAPAVAVSRFTSAADLGFGFSRPSSPKGEDEWGAMDTLASPLNVASWGSPRPPSPNQLPLRLPLVLDLLLYHHRALYQQIQEPVQKSIVGMSKEEKASEIARRKEERRLRIEKLKEQKKNAASAVR